MRDTDEVKNLQRKNDQADTIASIQEKISYRAEVVVDALQELKKRTSAKKKEAKKKEAKKARLSQAFLLTFFMNYCIVEK